MSKKMKRVAVETPSPPVYEDAKTRLKHLALLQDYKDLQKEVDDTRNKLDAAKERKLRLLAEVRFLRRRRNHLIEMKSLGRPQVAAPNMEKKGSLSTKGRNSQRKEGSVFKLPPLPGIKPKGKLYVMKEAVERTIAPALDLNPRHTLDGGKEASLRSLSLVSESNNRRRLSNPKEATLPKAEPAINLNLSQRWPVGNDTAFANKTPIFDLNVDTSFSGKEVSRAPIFDLNEISAEEEEMQNTYEPMKFEEAKIGLIRGGNEEQPADLKLSVCRNAGEGSSRMGKRKISWQDPVALRV